MHTPEPTPTPLHQDDQRMDDMLDQMAQAITSELAAHDLLKDDRADRARYVVRGVGRRFSNHMLDHLEESLAGRLDGPAEEFAHACEEAVFSAVDNLRSTYLTEIDRARDSYKALEEFKSRVLIASSALGVLSALGTVVFMVIIQ